MAASLEDAGVDVLRVSERDGGMLRTVHLSDGDTVAEERLGHDRTFDRPLSHERGVTSPEIASAVLSVP